MRIIPRSWHATWSLPFICHRSWRTQQSVCRCCIGWAVWPATKIISFKNRELRDTLPSRVSSLCARTHRRAASILPARTIRGTLAPVLVSMWMPLKSHGTNITICSRMWPRSWSKSSRSISQRLKVCRASAAIAWAATVHWFAPCAVQACTSPYRPFPPFAIPANARGARRRSVATWAMTPHCGRNGMPPNWWNNTMGHRLSC